MRRSIHSLPLVFLVFLVSVVVLAGCAGDGSLSTLLTKTGQSAQVQPASSVATVTPERTQSDGSTTGKSAAAPTALPADMTPLEALYARVNPSVVNIRVAILATASSSSSDSADPNR